MSIRRRLTLTLAALLVLLGTAGAALYVYVQRALVRQYDEVLLAKARSLGTLLRLGEDGKVEFDFSDNAMPEFAKSKAPEYFELWTLAGKVVERSESLKTLDLGWAPQKWAEPRWGNLTLPDGRAGRAVMLSVTPLVEGNESESETPKANPRPPALFVLAVARERENLNHTLTTIQLAGIGGGGILVLTFGVLVPYLIKRSLRPLDTIATQAEGIDADALSARFPVAEMPAELQPICSRLNDLLNRLQTAFTRERRFSADVAHELRTPISELRLLSDVALKFHTEGDEAVKSFCAARDIARQMESIVEALLEMIRADTPLAAVELAPMDFGECLARAWRTEQSQAQQRGTTLSVGAPEGVSVLADPVILQRVVGNLLANAVEYAPAGSVIEVGVELLPDRAVVTLKNPTTTLEEADLAHLAEPFWRKDTSRTGGRHAGLGLALVACYVRRLGGKIGWSLPQAGVFQVRLEIRR